MITDRDIKKLKEVFVTKDEFFPVKKDVEELKEDMKVVKETNQQILTIVDGLAKSFVDLKYEYVAVSLKGDRHEKWIKHIADKTNTDLPEV